LSQYFERVAAQSHEQPPIAPPQLGASDMAQADARDERVQDLVGGYLDTARLIGQRTAEMHRTLAANLADSAFAPEPFGKLYQRSIYQSMRNLTGRLCDRLARAHADLTEPAQALADRIIHSHGAILDRFRGILDPGLAGQRIRCHGDYQLGQLLFTGKDFIIIDFEGEASRTIGERRVKRTPLHDVASMIRSFDYAVQSVLLGLSNDRGRPPGTIRPEDRPLLTPSAEVWYARVVGQFVQSYIEGLVPSRLLPEPESARSSLLELLLLEKALAEIDAELTGGRDWIIIPLQAAVRILGQDAAEQRLHS
jgi:maltose alpha-D-glucosyltransferase/alpha-amylase